MLWLATLNTAPATAPARQRIIMMDVLPTASVRVTLAQSRPRTKGAGRDAAMRGSPVVTSPGGRFHLCCRSVRRRVSRGVERADQGRARPAIVHYTDRYRLRCG